MTTTAPPSGAPTSLVGAFAFPPGDEPLRAEAYGLDRLGEYARDLAQRSRLAPRRPARPPLLHRFHDNGRCLIEAHRQVGAVARRQEALTPDAEWLLDNFYVIEDVLREVRQDLPRGYYAQLPVLADGPLAGWPRVYALAIGLIAHTDGGIDENELLHFVQAYQTVTSLTIGELWAVPTMLRLGLVENLRRLAAQLVQTRADRDCAATWARRHLDQPASSAALVEPPERLTDACVVTLLQALRDQGAAGPAVQWLEDSLAQRGLTAAEVLRREHQRQAANQVSIGNCVTTLRLLAALDWGQFFEQTSVVE